MRFNEDYKETQRRQKLLSTNRGMLSYVLFLGKGAYLPSNALTRTFFPGTYIFKMHL